jgi:hypothetical protein
LRSLTSLLHGTTGHSHDGTNDDGPKLGTSGLATDAVDSTILKDDASVDANRAVTTNHIRDGAITPAKASSWPKARVFHNAAQSIPNDTVTALAFNSEVYDTDTIHDTVTNNSRLTCKTAGTYSIVASVSYAANTTGYRGTAIRLNGTIDLAQDRRNTISTASRSTWLTLSIQADLAVNDYVEVTVRQTSGGALDIEAASAYSPYFMMARLP